MAREKAAKVALHGAFLALFVVPLAASAAGEARVQFVRPDRFTDASGSGATSQAIVLAELERHIVRLARRLPAAQTLTVDVLDVDLAGRSEPGRGLASGTRTVVDSAPPRIRLSYVLSHRDRTLSSGSETLSDLNFRDRVASRFPSDPLGSEKGLLSDWFQARLAPFR